MQNISIQELSKYEVRDLQNLAEKLQEILIGLLQGNKDYELVFQQQDEIESQRKRLLCRAQEWNSNAFFVIVVGPVKSGKSTFVNLLANAEVSPTHFLECTVRPSIISIKKSEDKECMITPFFTTENPKMEHVDAIVDYIKGLNFADLEGSGIQKQDSAVLNKENLERIVSRPLSYVFGTDGEIALTSITANGGEFLKDDIYLIDMPGFDGVKSNIDQPFYKAIIGRADLIVFVQSSNSAINKISGDICKLITNNNGSAPVFFLHNYFDSAHWHKEDVQQKVVEGHMKKAMDFFSNNRISLYDDGYACINLGMVIDARNASAKAICKEGYEDILEKESKKFTDFEKKLTDSISSTHNKVRLINCISRTSTELAKLKEQLSKLKDILTETVMEYDKMNSLFDKLIRDWSGKSFQGVGVPAGFNFQDLNQDLSRIQTEFSKKNIDREIKYNTDRTRNFARVLVGLYLNTTTQHFDRFLSLLSVADVRKTLKNEFQNCISNEGVSINELGISNVELDKSLAATAIPELKPNFDGITEKYIPEKEIEKWYFKTRRGSDVVATMKSIETCYVGAGDYNGYIPSTLIPNTINYTKVWIKELVNKYKDACTKLLESKKKTELDKIAPNIENVKKRLKQVENLLKSLPEF